MTEFQARVKEALEDSTIYPDKMVCKRDGTVEVKKSYFYRMGNTAEKLAARVEEAIKATGLSVLVASRDEWKIWPATSYFVAIVGR